MERFDMDQMEMMREWVSERFDSTIGEVKETQRLQRETNGRLRTAEGEIANVKPRLRTVEREISEVKSELAHVSGDLRDGLSEIKDELKALAIAVAVANKPKDDDKDDDDDKKTGEERRVVVWDVGLVLATIFAVVAILKFFGRLQ